MEVPREQDLSWPCLMHPLLAEQLAMHPEVRKFVQGHLTISFI